MRALAVAARLGALALACAGTAAQAAVVERGFIPMSDGTPLNYVLTRPDGPGPFPVALTYGPYSESYRTAAALPQYDMATWLAEGYAHLSVGFRGTGCSGGTFQPFNAEQWGGDGAEVVEWAGTQPWSNGRVGMYGLSFPGTSQLATAAFSRSGHLKAIAPWASFPDLYRDITYPGGVFDSFVPLWIVAGRAFVGLAGGGPATEPAPECEINPPLYLGPDAAEANGVVLHPYFDDFYGRQPERFLDRIQVPVLGCVAWQDTTIYSRSYAMFRDRLAPDTTWLIANNGAHDNCARARGPVPPEGAAPLLRFFQHYVKGVDNGWERTPHLMLAHEVDADNKAGWTTVFQTWADVALATVPLTLHLHGDGRMDLLPPTAEEPPQTWRFPLPTSNTPGDWMGQSPYGNPAVSGAVVHYTTPALTADAEFLGTGSVDLWLSSTSTDTDVQVMLSEVRPDGQELFVQNGWLRWSHRALDAAQSGVLYPLHTHLEADARPLAGGEAALGRIELLPFNHVFRAGSAIRLSVDSPGKWFVPLSTPGTDSIHHRPDRDSRLVLGWIPSGRAQTPLPVCGSLLNQPCRENSVPVPAGALSLQAPAPKRDAPYVGALGPPHGLLLLLLAAVWRVGRRRFNPGARRTPASSAPSGAPARRVRCA